MQNKLFPNRPASLALTSASLLCYHWSSFTGALLSCQRRCCCLRSLCLKQNYHQCKESAECILRVTHPVLQKPENSEIPLHLQQTFQPFSICISLKELLLPSWKQQRDWNRMPSISYGIIYTQSRPFNFFIFKREGTTCYRKHILQTPPEPGFSKSLDSLIISFSGIFLPLLFLSYLFFFIFLSLSLHLSLSFSFRLPVFVFLFPSFFLLLSHFIHMIAFLLQHH